ncbi:uncharacterized protein LOC132198252 isoform X2 [Neocloeon triangulifer]|nr:uncharacterized protein LOC132198252 isoform X2 [Neocloeon triangulifer]XP_059478162.1 uncharacterized protein LOC132198252 isoform X2 [Neocloeon triangulifer]XP_059478163.1 uncharacterized protein LOC132198252 isoform X2 [Neocloeon triangulifer]
MMNFNTAVPRSRRRLSINDCIGEMASKIIADFNSDDANCTSELEVDESQEQAVEMETTFEANQADKPIDVTVDCATQTEEAIFTQTALENEAKTLLKKSVLDSRAFRGKKRQAGYNKFIAFMRDQLKQRKLSPGIKLERKVLSSMWAAIDEDNQMQWADYN